MLVTNLKHILMNARLKWTVFNDRFVEKLIKWSHLYNGMNKCNMLDKLYCKMFMCRWILHTVEKWHIIGHRCNETFSLISKYCTGKNANSSGLVCVCGCTYNGCNDCMSEASVNIHFPVSLMCFGLKTIIKGIHIQMAGIFRGLYVWVIRLILLINFKLVKCFVTSSDVTALK